MIKKFLVNSASGYARLIVNIAILLFLTPFIITHIGQDRYGIWALAISVIAMFELLDCGLATASMKFVAESFAKKDPKSATQYISTIFFLYLFIACVGTGIMTLLLWNDFYQTSVIVTYREIFFVIVTLMAFRLLWVMLPSSVFRGALTGTQKLMYVNLAQVIGILVYSSLTVGSLSMGFGINTLAVNFCISGIIESILLIIFCYALVPNFCISWRCASIETLKKMASFNSAQLIANITGFILASFDVIIVKLFFPFSEVAVYAIPLRVSIFCLMLVKQFTNALSPVIVEQNANAKQDRIREIFSYGTRYIWSMATVITIGGCLSSHHFFRLWLGDAFGSSDTIFIILLINFWLTVPIILGGDFLQLCGHHNFALVGSLAGSITHLAFSFFPSAQLWTDWHCNRQHLRHSGGLWIDLKKNIQTMPNSRHAFFLSLH